MIAVPSIRRKVAVFTGSRADYGILRALLAALHASSTLEAGLVVSGSHLSERFGMTVHEIENDGWPVFARVPIPVEDDTPVGVARSLGSAVAGIAEALQDIGPDLLIVLGDRYEALAAAIAATLTRVPVAHIHGGELTEGAVDDAFRHAITKMSLLHFTSTEEYRRRVIQLGESPDRVFAVGALGVDNALSEPRIPADELGRDLGFTFGFPTALATFHPVTLASDGGLGELDELLAALDELPELRVLLTMPNADAGNLALFKRLETWVADNDSRSAAFPSLGWKRYLSALAACDVVVGNSSSGIIEAPSFGKSVVDVGERQRGRIAADSVVHVPGRRAEIAAAIAQALTPDGRASAAAAVNPYGDGHAASRIVTVLEGLGPRDLGLTKRFHDADPAA